MDELQRLIDRLSRELGRGVMVEDTQQRLVVHSAHGDDVDPLRREAILHRQSPKAVRDWLRSLDVDAIEGWQRIPENPDLGMQQRICVPVRFEGDLLGHLWIIEGAPMREDELEKLRREASVAAGLMYRTRLMLQVENGLERERLRDLMAESESLRREARVHLVEAELVRPDCAVHVLVCLPKDEGHEFDDHARAKLDGVLHAVRTDVGRREFLYLIRPDHALCVLLVRADRAVAFVSQIAQTLQTRLDKAFDVSDIAMIVGQGDRKPVLEDAATSYKEALDAAHVAQAFPNLGSPVSWDQLGAFRLLTVLAKDGVNAKMLHPGVVALLDGKGADERLQMLELYLDSNGDASTVAQALDLHRTSVYYRIKKLEELMGVSLANGLDRLGVHMSVKLLRLQRSLKSSAGIST